ncbi:hypothetical protein ACMHYJ_08895 [Castellaniella hirudinis]|uniref:hypothetical protein n=1 Tax=Castellaniella hirudinis TaxID=1144617 RepID=UPI0039C17098
MRIRSLAFAVLGGLPLMLSACSWGGAADPAAPCRADPTRCLFEGAYEPGERGYAEAEAQRLNRAEAERLRRIEF